MPWKESRVEDERLQFVADWERGMWTMTELCRRHGVSRPTGYKWAERYRSEGLDGLKDRSRAPLAHPNATPLDVERAVLGVRLKYPSWGPRKIYAWLGHHDPELALPARSTIGEILRRNGLVEPRRRRRRQAPHTEPFVACTRPNAVWCVDFKGWFRAGNGERIDPLTVTDGFSRYLLLCRALVRAGHEEVRRAFERLFREFGLPVAIRSDNGVPFASRAAGGLSRLSVWWIRLGILPERIEPGRPEQNGRHERMHRTLKAETARPPRGSRRAQQRAFDAFRRVYNEERPHEALDQRPPETAWDASPRKYPRKVPKIEHDAGVTTRSVRTNGQIKWRGEVHFVSEVLAGETVGLRQDDERCWTVMFGPVTVARWDEATRTLQR